MTVKNVIRPILIFCICSLSLQCWSKSIDFNRDIRSILADHCFACHGPDQNKREGGKGQANGLRLDIATGAKADLGGYAAVVPGQPEHSALIARIMADDDSIMPPNNFHKALSVEQKQLLKQWISQGAVYDQHWAFIPPKYSTPPEILPKHHTSVSNWIDPYIISKLESSGLSPSPEANRHTLIRRLSFDIIGLPPSTPELSMLLTDNASTAYEKVVDRLLKSSHFGERMATYWLDLVRYADTNGYHADLTWNVWPYRDYVIKAFNDNMPFDQFTLEQLAGDLIPNATLSQQVAAEDQSSKEQLESELKHHQGISKFRMPDLKLIRQELKEWLQGIESKKIALHSLIKQITIYTNATLEVTYNAGYLTNQTRALDYTPYGS
ncbi:TPA: DUF1549 domain-containing protein [Candidatus Poribacteria bacterium]|nr:DUF1549 domain-containing protein [Candidatus Poribacteria bacterium]